MYKRKLNQVTIFEDPAMFGGISLNPNNAWVKLANLIPWWAFEEKYAEQFPSDTGQPADSLRVALGSQLIKEKYHFSDEMVVEEIAMNPYLQYFLGFPEYRQTPPFDPSMMTRFRQRLTPELIQEVNDVIIGRKKAEDVGKDSHDDDPPNDDGGSSEEEPAFEESEDDSKNEGTLILDATCAPQNIRFPTDVSLLNEARMNTEEIIDAFHKAGLTEGKKPRTYRREAKKKYNRFSKARKKTKKNIKTAKKRQLNYLRRNLKTIQNIIRNHPDRWENALTNRQRERLETITLLYEQQREMYETHTNRIDNRIVSLSQPWVRPIVRGKQNAEVEFGAKIELSDVDGFLRIEDFRWDAFNESTTLKDSVEAYRKAYGHYPKRVLADTIFRTRENVRYCKSHHIHLNGPKLGRPTKNPEVRKAELLLEWLESGERGDIERRIGIGKRTTSLGLIAAKLEHTSEVMAYTSVLTVNLQKRLRLLLRLLLALFRPARAV